jgi:DNA-binding IclR family transcriptional regulator
VRAYPLRIFVKPSPEPEQGRVERVRSVDRAVSVLQLLARAGDSRVTDIAEAIGTHKSTAARLLATLEARGLVEQDGERGRYRLGYGVIELARHVAATRPELPLLARAACEALAEETGETVNLAVADGDAVVSIDQVLGTATVRSVNWVGQRTPLHATAAGKVLLAFGEEGWRDEVLARPLERFTPSTIVEADRLRDDLAKVRARGYASTRDEHEPGLSAVGAPVRASDGTVIAAVTVSGPSFRLPAARVRSLAPAVVRAGELVSQLNGWPTRAT